MTRSALMRSALSRAGAVLTRHFGKVAYKQKRRADLLTVADLESQRTILDLIVRAFPDDDFKAEEDEVKKLLKRKDYAAQEVTKELLTLCRRQTLTLEQLSKLLGRQPKNLRDAYLTQMVREGVLQLKYPHAPNRPDQAYTAAPA